jgi:hypothetical protein
MKRTVLSILAIAMIMTASAQLSFGVNANYTMYKGSFQRSTIGSQIRASYAVNEKAAAVLSFNYGFPIKDPSLVMLQDNFGGTKTVASEINYKFKTFNLLGNYTFVGDDESTGKFYGLAGIGVVLVSYDETIKENYDKNTYTPMDQVKGKDNGFTINLGLGGEYRLGAPALFAEAGLALPANQANGQYIENPIPAHFILNVGVKFNFGGGDY